MSTIKEKHGLAESGVLHLKDAAGELMYAEGADGKPDESKPIRVHVHGPGSKIYGRAKLRESQRLLDRMQKTGKVKASAEEMMADRVEFLVAVTKAIENADDAPHDLYSDPETMHIRDQVSEYVNETANFKRAPSTN